MHLSGSCVWFSKSLRNFQNKIWTFLFFIWIFKWYPFKKKLQTVNFPNLKCLGTKFIKLNIYIFKALALWADAFYNSKCPSVCVFVCLFVHVFIFEVPFKRLFTLISRSCMSKNFRDSESLGEKKCKEVVSH